MKTVVVVIGHSSGSQGARNPSRPDISEWVYNRQVAAEVLRLAAHERLVDLRLVHRGDEGGDSYELNETVEMVNAHGPDLALSLHCNALDQQREGHAVLHWPSPRGEQAAGAFMAVCSESFGNPNHGRRQREDLAFLRNTRCTAILLEPFFIDNDEDCARGLTYQLRYAHGLYHAAVNLLNAWG